MILSAAAFEAFRLCVKDIYAKLDIYSEANQQLDRTGLVVNESISIKQERKGRQLYRINLHLTTSTVSVNGRHLDEFVNVHLQKILDEMSRIGDFQQVNNYIKENCLKILDERSHKNGNKDRQAKTLREIDLNSKDTIKVVDQTVVHENLALITNAASSNHLMVMGSNIESDRIERNEVNDRQRVKEGKDL